MTHEIRVTVVATGLGQAAMRPQQEAPMRIVNPAPARPRETNYRDFDTPSVQRKQAIPEELMGDDAALQEMLDVPAFLRRQAN
jgi:cell division protein FtsZ